MAEASGNDSETQTYERLLAAFRAVDTKGSGRMDRAGVVGLLSRLGFSDTDAGHLIDGSGCCAAGDGLDYAAFLRWLVCGAAASGDLLDAGAAATPKALASPSATCGSWPERCARLLEARGEADFVQKRLIAAQVRAHLQRVSEAEAGGLGLPAQPAAARTRSRPVDQGPVAEGGKVPTLRWDGPALLQRFLLEGADGLPRTYVEEVLSAMLTALPAHRPKALARMRVPQGGRLVVVGDTHGQLQDVLLIMLLHGSPGAKNAFLFNGDVADRGPHACEIFVLIFAFFLGDPGSVLLTRGNHEDEHMNMMSSDSGGGFYDECLRKYGETTYWTFVEVFKLLPIAAVVNEEVFVVHGGLPGGEPASLAAIEALPHTAVCCPHPDADSPEERLHIQLLWSDPMESPGYQPNPRGSGALWGPDLTKAFLERNGLRWMIRSHELPWDGERGWMEHHLGLVFTVFSASNYCGYEVNWGAVALLTVGADGHVEQALREHNVSGLEVLAEVAEAPEGPAREERCLEIGLAWADSARVAVGERRLRLALRRLAGIVLECKPDLWKKFRESDPLNRGSIPREKWVECLVAACGDDLPWEEACKCWVTGPPEQRVDYRHFLGRFRVTLAQERWCGWKSLVIADVYEELMSRHATAEEMIRTFDPSGDGVVSVEDFMQMMRECSGDCLTEPQIAALTRTVFAHAQGRGLKVSSFLSRFTLAFVQSKGMTPSERQSPLMRFGPTLDQIGKLIVRARAEALRQPTNPVLLNRLRPPPVDWMPKDPASAALPPAPLPLDRAASAHPAAGGAPHAAETAGVQLPPMLDLHRTTSAVPAMPSALGNREPSSALLRSFELFNDAGDGLLQVDEFVSHVAALPGIREVRHEGRPLDEAGLREIAEAIACECGGTPGTISLLQFARAFAAVDASGSEDLADDLHEHILVFLWRHQHALRSSCAENDLEESGRVSRRDFARVLEAVNFCTAKPARHLTRQQMDVLVESAVEDDGCVEYEAFLSSLEVEAD